MPDLTVLKNRLFQRAEIARSLDQFGVEQDLLDAAEQIESDAKVIADMRDLLNEALVLTPDYWEDWAARVRAKVAQ